MRSLPKDVAGRLCKGIRAFLGWDQNDLTKSAKININTIRNFENDKTDTHHATILSIDTAFKENGIIIQHDEEQGEVLIKYKYRS